MRGLTISLAQLECHDGRLERNLEKLEAVVRDVGGESDLIVFPEAYVTGFNSPEASFALAEPLDGPVCQFLLRVARAHHAGFMVGMLELSERNVYNTSLWVEPEGIRLAYRKIHRWIDERERVSPGDTVSSRRWRDTQLGMLICFDVEFPETSRALAATGADVILLTNGNMAPYGETHQIALRARALENQVFMAAANRVGTDGQVRYVGESMVVDPYGHIVDALGDTEGILTVSLDLDLLEESRTPYRYLDERRIRLQAPEISIGRDGVSAWRVTEEV